MTLKKNLGQNKTRRHTSAAARLLVGIALFIPVASCSVLDKGLQAVAPDKIETTGLEQPANANLLVLSAVGNFECALGTFVAAGGLMSGELIETTQTASRWSYDRRDIDPSESQYSTFSCEGLGVYTPVQIARGTADNILKLLQGWTDAQVPNRTALIAKAANYAGYSRILLGEAFCEAAIDQGPKLTSMQIFASAEEKFTVAIAAAQTAGDAAMLNMAYVGRARARLDQANKAGALADASLVQSGFVINATAEITSGRRQNRVQSQNQGMAVSIAPAYRGLTVTDSNGNQVPDSRVTVVDAGRKASDNQTPLFYQTKYATGASPIPIASYKEAQLIIAEVSGGQTAVNIINASRAAAGLPSFQSSDATVIANQVIEERRRVLFLEGQHLNDVRRLNLPLVPAAGLQYSTVYAKGGVYGTERCMPLPDVERLNNPNIG